MPISKFGRNIAFALRDYLVEDNTSTLDSSNAYDTAQQAARAAYQGMGAATSYAASYFWSKPATPSTSAGSNKFFNIPGKDGVKRAVNIARIFKIVYSEPGLQSALSSEAMLGEPPSRSSELTNDAFGLTAIDHLLDNQIIAADCDNIIAFITHKDKLYNSTSGKRVLEVIKKSLRIDDHVIKDEIAELNSPTVEAGGVVQDYTSPSDAPNEFRTPEMAVFKIIFDRATELKKKIAQQPIWGITSTNTPTYQGVSASSASGTGRVSATSRRPSVHSVQSSGGRSSAQSSGRSSAGGIFDMSPPSTSRRSAFKQ